MTLHAYNLRILETMRGRVLEVQGQPKPSNRTLSEAKEGEKGGRDVGRELGREGRKKGEEGRREGREMGRKEKRKKEGTNEYVVRLLISRSVFPGMILIILARPTEADDKSVFQSPSLNPES